MSSDELRGSAPVYSAKDVLVRLDGKMDLMDGKLDAVDRSLAILLSQNLGDRMTAVETWQNRAIGIASSARIVAFIGTLLGVIAVAWQIVDKISGA